ncbi:MAG: cytidine deaminase [Candidatus Melainabacteria bacterium]|nr:cytidine deaminase [Candidatus Melainabacteria bacterium]
MSTLGLLTKHSDLVSVERDLVALAWDVSTRAHCFQSNFPVGAALVAVNAAGVSKTFSGCNVENDSFAATICAERNAATTAIAEGFTCFTHVAVVCRKHPGGSPCGLCRQVLRQFGSRDAVLLNICDHDSNVLRATVGELLPAPSGKAEPYCGLHYTERQIVDRVLRQVSLSHVPYSKKARGAVVVAANAEGDRKRYAGTQVDNASYGGTMSAERGAIAAAVSAGYKNILKLAVSGENPIDGECLQVLREFGGLTADVLFVGADKSVVRATLDQLLPDSFGPESL